ncbi:recombinase family protein [Streptomyces sp. NPDC058614]|uniref:recombinase family protein n=1 Tax=Streptomyces sp. NPDC058614 TaxID=3346557 RepID=UPI00365ED119
MDYGTEARAAESDKRRPQRVAVYGRVSTDEQRRGYGIAAQEAAVRAFMAERPGWRETETYRDLGESGASQSRPGLNRLVHDITAGDVDVVIVHRLDRLGRTVSAIWRCIWQIEDAGARLLTCSQEISGDLIQRVATHRLALAVEADYAGIRDRLQGGRQAKALEGGWPGGPPPYGYRIRGKGELGSVLEIDPAEAAGVEVIVELFVDRGLNLPQAVEELNARGIPTRSGKTWSSANLARRLQSAAFTGEAIFRNQDRQWGGHATRLRENGSPVHGESVSIQVPPILDDDLRRQLQHALAGRRRPRRNPIAKYPLSGRITGVCGRPYVGCLRAKDMLRTYRCSGVANAESCRCVFLPADDVEAVVRDRLSAVLSATPVGKRPAVPAPCVSPGRVDLHQKRVKELSDAVAGLEEALQGLDQSASAEVSARFIAAAAARQVEADLQSLREIMTEAQKWLRVLERSVAWSVSLNEFFAAARPDVRALSAAESYQVIGLLDVRVRLSDAAFRHREGRTCQALDWHRRTGTLVPSDPSDAQWEQIDALLHERHAAHHFRTELDLRAALLGMLHRLRTGTSWVDLPGRFGQYGKVHVRQTTWLKCGTWQAIMDVLKARTRGTPVPERPRLPSLVVTSSFHSTRVRGDVRVNQHGAAGERQTCRPRRRVGKRGVHLVASRTSGRSMQRLRSVP